MIHDTLSLFLSKKKLGFIFNFCCVYRAVVAAITAREWGMKPVLMLIHVGSATHVSKQVEFYSACLR